MNYLVVCLLGVCQTTPVFYLNPTTKTAYYAGREVPHIARFTVIPGNPTRIDLHDETIYKNGFEAP
jgi:hypothetical protein